MGEDELALQKAINSEDTDLIYLALIHLERSYVGGLKEAKPGSHNSFYRLIYSHPEAANLLKVYYRNKITRDDRVLLHDLLMFNKNYLEAGIMCVNQSYMKVLTHLLAYSLTYWLTYSPNHLLTHILTYSPTHLLTHLLTHSPTYSLTYLLTHLLTHSLTYSLTHSLTYSLLGSFASEYG